MGRLEEAAELHLRCLHVLCLRPSTRHSFSGFKVCQSGDFTEPYSQTHPAGNAAVNFQATFSRAAHAANPSRIDVFDAYLAVYGTFIV